MRRKGLLLMGGLLLPLALAANAAAQGARLQLSPSTASPGQTVTVTGAGFNQSSTRITGGVDIRLSSRDSEPRANTIVLSDGTIRPVTFDVPSSLTPREYLVLGTQVSIRGRHTFGGPGRAKLRVVAAGGAVPPGRSPSAPPAPVVLGAILALIFLAAGTTLTVRRLRTVNQPLGS